MSGVFFVQQSQQQKRSIDIEEYRVDIRLIDQQAIVCLQFEMLSARVFSKEAATKKVSQNTGTRKSAR